MHTKAFNSKDDILKVSATVISEPDWFEGDVGGIFVNCPEISEDGFYTHMTGAAPEYDKNVTEYQQGESLVLTYEKDEEKSIFINRYKLVSVEEE